MGSKTIWNETVADAVSQGLSSTPKSLPSWLFYDETGDGIFREIMRMPEYYPTRCEYDILQQNKEDLLDHFGDKRHPFRLIELGAGDGLKTEILLRHFTEKGIPFTYIPVDISANALGLLSQSLVATIPELNIQPVNQNYEDALTTLRTSTEKKVILFMGANIGNFTVAEALSFLKKIVISMSDDDLLLIGFDLKKDPRVIHEAYDDPQGLTAKFNLNLLSRINREIGANFDPDQFTHYPYYDPETGAMKSFLMSMKEQTVHIAALNKSVHFDLWETVQTEVSQKYDLRMIEKMMGTSGMRIEKIYYDPAQYFCDVLARRIS